jgi:hypothetical protein
MHRTVAFGLLAASGILGACSGIESFDAEKTSVEAGKAVVALSLDASDVAGVEVPQTGWRLVAATMHWDAPRPVAVGTVTSDVSFLIVETPAASLELGQVRLVWKSGPNRFEQYGTVGNMPAIPVEPGAFRYAGNVRIVEVRYDPENLRPQQLVLDVNDAWEGHRDRWRKTYRLAGQVDPEHRIAAEWGRELVVDLRRLRPTRDSGWTYTPRDYHTQPRTQPSTPTGGDRPNSR